MTDVVDMASAAAGSAFDAVDEQLLRQWVKSLGGQRDHRSSTPTAPDPTRRGRDVLAAGIDRDQDRGTRDCLIVVCDGLTGLPDGVAAAWPQTSVQT